MSFFADTQRRPGTIRRACRLDLTGDHGHRANPAMRLRYGGHLRWHGLDVFHFDTNGRITGKLTCATFRLPLMERDA
jgi:hypothetical protein